MSSSRAQRTSAAFTAPTVLTTSRAARSSICRPRRNPIMKAGPNTRTAAITGASGGIGEQTAVGLVRTLPNLSKLFLCCRNTEKGEEVAKPLREGLVAGRKIDVTVVPVELMDVKSVVTCASTIDDSLAGESLDLLICNAGIMAPPLAFTSNPGELGRIESQYAVNHLSHAVLTDQLLPALRKDGGRVVFVSSAAVSFSRGRNTAPLVAEKTEGVVDESNYSKWKAYGDSKLAMSLYAKGLAEREGDVESVSLHPGVVQTELARHLVPERFAGRMNSGSAPGLLSRAFSWFGFKTAPQGAELSIELSQTPEGGFENGAMFVATGLKKAPHYMIPLLDKQEEYESVYGDTQTYIKTVVGDCGEGATAEEGVAVQSEAVKGAPVS